MTPALSLYLLATRLAARRLHRRDDARLVDQDVPSHRRLERLGHHNGPRPDGRLIWINAVSVGETQSVLPLIAEICAQGPQVLLTTTTATAADLACRRLPDGARHAYAPLDTPRPVQRFLNHWQPDLAICVESDLWPRQILETTRRGTPMALVNARLSDSSLRLWSRMPGTARKVFGSFDLVACQNRNMAKALTALGARNPKVTGDLKAAAAPLPVDENARTALTSSIAGRPLWLAASTHPGEEDAVAAAHRHAPDGTLLILVPRHPERGPAIEEMLQSQGWRITRRSTGALPGPDTQIYIADTLGELGLFYATAPLAFIGASLTSLGGHNPYEAIPFGTALITGPHRFNFQGAFEPLIDAGACVEIPDDKALAQALPDLLSPNKLAQMQTAMRNMPQADPALPARLASKLMALLPPH